jgi:hypothetical protein
MNPFVNALSNVERTGEMNAACINATMFAGVAIPMAPLA